MARNYTLGRIKPSGGLIRAHVVELRTTSKQATYLTRCAGTMRFVYNTLVAKIKAGDKYERKTFQKHCVNLRQTTPWMQEITSRATYEAADNFHRAMQNFFDSVKGKRKGRKMGLPGFKKKGRTPAVLQFSHSTQFSVDDRRLRIAGLKQEIRMRENIRFKGQVKSLSIRLRAGRWFATFVVELDETLPAENTQAQKPRAASVGVDFGLSVLAALSTGEMIPNPKPLRAKLRLLRRRQRQTSRKYVKGQPQSRRYEIAAACVVRLHKKVADQRAATQHAFTTNLVRRFNRIVIEDLAVGNMVKNRKLSRAISDVGWSALRHQIAYKAKAAGVTVVVADRFYASSKTCSCCGVKKEKLALSTRTFHCDNCGLSINRDTNAALNLASYEAPVATNQGDTGLPKPRALAVCKSHPQGKAAVLDGANTKSSTGDATQVHSRARMVTVN